MHYTTITFSNPNQPVSNLTVRIADEGVFDSPGSVEWPQFHAQTQKYMDFADSTGRPSVQSFYRAKQMRLWQSRLPAILDNVASLIGQSPLSSSPNANLSSSASPRCQSSLNREITSPADDPSSTLTHSIAPTTMPAVSANAGHDANDQSLILTLTIGCALLAGNCLALAFVCLAVGRLRLERRRLRQDQRHRRGHQSRRREGSRRRRRRQNDVDNDSDGSENFEDVNKLEDGAEDADGHNDGRVGATNLTLRPPPLPPPPPLPRPPQLMLMTGSLGDCPGYVDCDYWFKVPTAGSASYRSGARNAGSDADDQTTMV